VDDIAVEEITAHTATAAPRCWRVYWRRGGGIDEPSACAHHLLRTRICRLMPIAVIFNIEREIRLRHCVIAP